MKASSSLRSFFFLLFLIAVTLAFPAARVSAVDSCYGVKVITEPLR